MKSAEVSKDSRPVTIFRFEDEEHKQLVHRAAKKAKRSANSWMASVTLEAAQEQLRRA